VITSAGHILPSIIVGWCQTIDSRPLKTSGVCRQASNSMISAPLALVNKCAHTVSAEGSFSSSAVNAPSSDATT